MSVSLCVLTVCVCARSGIYTNSVGGRERGAGGICMHMHGRTCAAIPLLLHMHARTRAENPPAPLSLSLFLSLTHFLPPSLTPSLPHNTHTKHTQNTHTHNTRDNSRPSQPLNNTLATRKQHINNTLATPRRVTSIYQRHTHRRQLETNSAPQRSHYTLRPLGQGAGAAGGLLKAKTVDLVDAERDRAMRRRRRRRRRRRGKGFMVCSKQ